MPILTALLAGPLLAGAALASQAAPDPVANNRLRLEQQRRELLATIADQRWMQEQGRATIARLQVEKYWKECAENEALALARASERPARLIAEAALATCSPWRNALELALQNGAYPYVEGGDARPLVSRDDMTATAELDARDAALSRILMWRGSSPAKDAPPAPKPADPGARIEPRHLPIPDRLAPPEPPEPEAPAAPAGADDEAVIVVVGRIGGCRVRLADKTLSEAELAAKAREWAANRTALKVVRPRGADYRCMAKIAWQLGKQGLRWFEFVEASDLQATKPPR